MVSASSTTSLSKNDRESYELVFSAILVAYSSIVLGEEIGQGMIIIMLMCYKQLYLFLLMYLLNKQILLRIIWNGL